MDDLRVENVPKNVQKDKDKDKEDGEKQNLEKFLLFNENEFTIVLNDLAVEEDESIVLNDLAVEEDDENSKSELEIRIMTYIIIICFMAVNETFTAVFSLS